MSTEPPKYRWCSQDNDQISALMKQYLIQHALSDEWYRVFLGEKRVGLGIFIGFSYIIGMFCTLCLFVCLFVCLFLLILLWYFIWNHLFFPTENSCFSSTKKPLLYYYYYYKAITWSVVTSARMNGTAALVMIPSLLASMVSGYINIVIFWENKQLEYKRKRGFNFDRLE